MKERNSNIEEMLLFFRDLIAHVQSTVVLVHKPRSTKGDSLRQEFAHRTRSRDGGSLCGCWCKTAPGTSNRTNVAAVARQPMTAIRQLLDQAYQSMCL